VNFIVKFSGVHLHRKTFFHMTNLKKNMPNLRKGKVSMRVYGKLKTTQLLNSKEL